jgi:hypothetical protein
MGRLVPIPRRRVEAIKLSSGKYMNSQQRIKLIFDDGGEKDCSSLNTVSFEHISGALVHMELSCGHWVARSMSKQCDLEIRYA